MALREKISEDVKTALKGGKPVETGVLRLLISALNNKAIDKKGKTGSEDLSEEEVIQVLMTEAKKRRESIEIFTKGDRKDLADKEKLELAIVQGYLPKQISKEEAEKLVSEILKKSGATEIGLAMKAVMAELKGKADAGMVSQLVKEKLNK